MTGIPAPMSWRFADACLLKLKLSDRHDSAWWDAYDTLRGLLEDLATRVAIKRFGHSDLKVTLAAVASVLDGVVSCRTYFFSSHFLVLHLLAAYRAVRRLPPPESATAAWPLWYLVLGELIDLTRAPWAYFRLAAARGTKRGWKGRLADDYLGPNRYPLLTGHLNSRTRVEGELQRTCTSVDSGDAGDDSVARLVAAIYQKAPAFSVAKPKGAVSPCRNRASAAKRVLSLVAKCRPAGGYAAGPQSADREHWACLARALDDVAQRLGPLGPTVAGAVEELCREIEVPGSMLPAPPGLLAVLSGLPLEHEAGIERPPAAVLGAISGYPLPEEPAPALPVPEDPIPHDRLIDRMNGRIPAESPLSEVLRALVACEPVTLLWQTPGLRPLPALGEMVQGKERRWLQRARAVLLEWRAHIAAFVVGGDGLPVSSFDGLEIPISLWENSSLIAWCIAELDEVLGDQDPAARAWAGLSPECRPGVLAALYVVLVQEVSKILMAVYNER